MNTYDKGDFVRVSGAFTDSEGVDVDPDVVYFSWIKPDNTQVTYTYGIDTELVQVSTGHYRVDVDADLEGTHYYRFYSTGSGKAGSPFTGFRVEETRF